MKTRSNAMYIRGAAVALLMSTVNCGAEADIEAISDSNIQTQTSAIENEEVVALRLYEHSNFEGTPVPVPIAPDNLGKDVTHHWNSTKHPKRSFILAPYCGAEFAKDEEAHSKGDYRFYEASAEAQYNSYPSHLKNDGFVEVFCYAWSDQRTSATAYNVTDSNLASIAFYGNSTSVSLPSSWAQGGIDVFELDGATYPETYAYFYGDASSDPLYAMLATRAVVSRILPNDVSEQVVSVQFQPSANGCKPTNTCWTSTDCTGRYSLMNNGQPARTLQECVNSTAGVSWCPPSRVCLNLVTDL
ncbi:MAG: hypothetical protein AAFZ38_00400 [Myxococcota bacterium]